MNNDKMPLKGRIVKESNEVRQFAISLDTNRKHKKGGNRDKLHHHKLNNPRRKQK